MLKPVLSTIATLVAFSAPVFAEGDAVKGEKVFKKCKACHAVGDDAKNKVGPVLNGVVGSPAGAQAEFKYSEGMLTMAAEGLVWDEASLTEYLTKPRDFVSGTKMTFAGLRKQDDIDNVVAYLAIFN